MCSTLLCLSCSTRNSYSVLFWFLFVQLGYCRVFRTFIWYLLSYLPVFLIRSVSQVFPFFSFELWRAPQSIVVRLFLTFGFCLHLFYSFVFVFVCFSWAHAHFVFFWFPLVQLQYCHTFKTFIWHLLSYLPFSFRSVSHVVFFKFWALEQTFITSFQIGLLLLMFCSLFLYLFVVFICFSWPPIVCCLLGPICAATVLLHI